MHYYARPIDMSIVVALLAAGIYASSTAYAASSPASAHLTAWQTGLWAVAAALSLSLAALFAYVSSGTAAWPRSLHLGHNIVPGTSLRHARKAGGKLPCPYPDAWYAVCLSHELACGQLLDATVCNVNLVVWRPTSGGAPVVMDAYCPHLGAHLALGGGRVEGDCVRCPFHGWQFDRSGAVTCVPGSDTVPKGGGIRTWTSQEVNGVVSVWMHSASHKARQGMSPKQHQATTTTTCDGAGEGCAVTSTPAGAAEAELKLAPWFNIPVIEHLNGPHAWTYHGYCENIVNAVIFEIPENGSDVAHLPILHKEFIVPSLSFALSHQWDATWASDSSSPRRHIADITVNERVALFERALPGEVRVKITQAGPSQVFLQMSTPVGQIIVVETVTPVAPMQLRVLHALYAPSYVPTLIAKVVLYATMVQFEKDVPVWCNKQYAPLPTLSKADRMISTYRRWATQFYNGDSITFEEAAKQHMADQMGLPLDAKLDW